MYIEVKTKKCYFTTELNGGNYNHYNRSGYVGHFPTIAVVSTEDISDKKFVKGHLFNKRFKLV